MAVEVKEVARFVSRRLDADKQHVGLSDGENSETAIAAWTSQENLETVCQWRSCGVALVLYLIFQ